MINLYEKGRIPSDQKEILTKSFLIEKIANDLKLKYKKVFSFINYDDFTLKNDIHSLLSKYISNNKREINIKYIETTLLNKVRAKYRKKSPLKPINKNLNNNKLIKIINSPSKKNFYIKIEETNTKRNKLPVIKKRNNDFIKANINKKNNHSKTCETIDKKDNSNEIEKLNEIDKKIAQLANEDKIIKEELNKEKDEITILEEYKKDIQNQINNLNKEIEKENELLQKEQSKKNNVTNINDNNIIDNNNNNSINQEECKNEVKEKKISVINPLMSYEQMKYLERKKKIEEDCYNKQNKYIFLKSGCNNDGNNLNNSANNTSTKRPFYFNNIKINTFSSDNIKKIYEKNKSLEIPKDNENNRYNNFKINDINKFSFADFVDYNDGNKTHNKKMNTIMPYEERMQLKILHRSIAQEKAFNNLRKILSPENELLRESNYQGFNNKSNDNIFERKKKEYERVDEARKIQVEKMKKLLDENIYEREKRKKAEKEFDKKYREINERNSEDFMERENKKKFVKIQKMQLYRKMLDEQIEQKKKLMLNNDQNQPFSFDMFS